MLPRSSLSTPPSSAWLRVLRVLIPLLALPACSPTPHNSAGLAGFTPQERDRVLTLSPLPPPPPDPTNRIADDPAAARLGQFLFFDPRLSRDGTVSCATCHDPGKSFTDGQRLPERFGPRLRHVPSLWNVAYQRWFFWDGRADSLWSQALGPLEHPDEHAGSRAQFSALIASDPPLRRAYLKLFASLPDVGAVPAGIPRDPPDRVLANLGKAIAAYERRLVSRHAPFDTFAQGLATGDPDKLAALSPSAQRGLKLFVGRAGCRDCHHGPNFTDGEFHDTGVAALAPTPTPDPGRFAGVATLLASPFNALGPYCDDPAGRGTRPTAFLVNDLDRSGQFKTPTLRNCAVTAPYMHRGQLATLADVLRFYSTLETPTVSPRPAPAPGAPVHTAQAEPARPEPAHTHGRGRERVLVPLHLTPEEAADLEAFLESLTDTALDPALQHPPPTPD